MLKACQGALEAPPWTGNLDVSSVLSTQRRVGCGPKPDLTPIPHHTLPNGFAFPIPLIPLSQDPAYFLSIHMCRRLQLRTCCLFPEHVLDTYTCIAVRAHRSWAPLSAGNDLNFTLVSLPFEKDNYTFAIAAVLGFGLIDTAFFISSESSLFWFPLCLPGILELVAASLFPRFSFLLFAHCWDLDWLIPRDT